MSIISDKKSLAILLITILAMITDLTACNQSAYKMETAQAREHYSFSLSNDSFIGGQNNQEIGDYEICFYGNIGSFTGITIGKGANEDVWKEWLQITDEKITVLSVEDQKIEDEVEHGLTFKDYISINIIADLNGKATIEILTNGGEFKSELNWTGRNGRLYAEATGGNTILYDCSLSYYCNGWDKDIWLYGDSYFSMTEPERWTTYLIRNGASDIMLSGRSGEGSVESLEALKTQLQYGSPRTVVWCVGMNDGDSEDAINPEYKKCLDEVTKICDDNDIELILATIPTCPYWFNDYKNEYIKSQDHTVIDFADTVGSKDSITWKENMLEEGDERIHPTVNGALAMYAKAVATVPDLLKQ